MATAQEPKKYTVGNKYTVLASEILADFEWNARSGNWKEATGDEETDNDFADLVKTIKTRGQDEPVVVIATEKKGKPLELVAGFRRFAAIQKIAEDTKNKAPTIDVIVKTLTPVEQRSLNIRENTARNNLKGADLAFALADLVRMYKDSGVAVTSVAIAEEIGKNQSYVAILLRIVEKVKPTILKQWRETPLTVNVREMDLISRLEPQLQDAKWKEILSGKSAKGEKGPDAWKETVVTKSANIGALLGKLVREGLIEMLDFSFDDPDHLAVAGVKPKKDAKLPKAACKAGQVAFDEALKEEPTQAESEA